MVRFLIGSILSLPFQRKSSAGVVFQTLRSGIKSFQSSLNHFRPVSMSLPPDDPSGLWSLGKLNHIAVACPDLQQAADFYRNVLGAEVSEAVPLPEHGVYTVFVNLGNTKIELLHPYGEKSPIQSFLEKNKSGGLHHICIEVKNIANAMAHVKSKNIRCLSENATIGAHGKPVVFLHPKDCNGVLIELEEA